jgi:hypothetical protein
MNNDIHPPVYAGLTSRRKKIQYRKIQSHQIHMNQRIAILTGGISTERAVALRSGENMRAWCTHAGHTVDLYDIPENIDAFLEKYREYHLVIPMLH